MESKPATPESPTLAAERGRRSALRIGGIAFGILLLAIFLFLVLTSLSGRKVVWLTPAEFARSTQPGPFTTFKQKVKTLASPLWRYYRRTRLQIRIDSSMLTLSAAAAEIRLGAPVTTNANGMRAWILLPAELNALQAQFKTNAGALLVGAARVQTFDGSRAQLSHTMQAPTWGKPTTVLALTVDLIPKVVSGSVKLTTSVTYTEMTAPPPGKVFAVKTNLTAACRVFLPNGGGLVVEEASVKDAIGDIYLLILSPTVFDAQGNPIKP